MKVIHYKSPKAGLAVLSTLIFVYSFICMTKYCFSSAMVFIVDEGYMTKFQTGTITAAFWAVYAATQIFGGIAADRFDPEKLVVVGLIGAALSNLAVYFCYQNFILTTVVWALNAAFQFAVWPATFKIISTVMTGKISSLGMVIVTLANPFGTMASYLVAALTSKWQNLFLISSIGLMGASLMWMVVTHIASRSAVINDIGEKGSAEALKDERSDFPIKISFMKLVLSSGLIFISGIAFFRMMFNQIQTLVPVMINEAYTDVAPNVATMLSLIVLFCNTLGPIIGGLVAKKIKNEVAAIALFLVLTFPLTFVTLNIGKINYWMIIVALGAIVFLSSAAGYFTTTLIAVKFNKWGKGATVAGALNAFSSIGIVASNLFFTFVAEKGGWSATLTSVAIFVGVALLLSVIAMFIWKKFVKLEL